MSAATSPFIGVSMTEILSTAGSPAALPVRREVVIGAIFDSPAVSVVSSALVLGQLERLLQRCGGMGQVQELPPVREGDESSMSIPRLWVSTSDGRYSYQMQSNRVLMNFNGAAEASDASRFEEDFDEFLACFRGVRPFLRTPTTGKLEIAVVYDCPVGGGAIEIGNGKGARLQQITWTGVFDQGNASFQALQQSVATDSSPATNTGLLAITVRKLTSTEDVLLDTAGLSWIRPSLAFADELAVSLLGRTLTL